MNTPSGQVVTVDGIGAVQLIERGRGCWWARLLPPHRGLLQVVEDRGQWYLGEALPLTGVERS